VRVAVRLRDQVQQFARTVVFGRGIGAACIHAAGHLAGPELVRSVPQRVVARGIGIAEPQQRVAHHRAIADPRARVRARAGSQLRAVARDQDPRQRTPQRVREPLRLGRQAQRDAVQSCTPFRCDGILCMLQPRARIRAGGNRRQCRIRQRRDHAEGSGGMRRQLQAVQCHAGSKTGRIDRRMRGRYLVVRKPLHDRTLRMCRRAHCIGCPQQVCAWLAVHHQGIALPRQRMDRADATGSIEELRGRIDLERPRRKCQRDVACLVAVVAYVIACDEVRIAARASAECGHAQSKIPVSPCRARDWQIAITKRVRDRGIGPRHQLAVVEQERFQREATLADLQRTVFGQQAGIASAVDADQRPVNLLAGKPAWIETARRVLRERFEPSVRVVGQRWRRRLGGCRRRQFGQRQSPEARAAAAAAASGSDGQFQRGALRERVILARSPGKRDVVLGDPPRRPCFRHREIGPRMPPHVVAAGIDQLELQRVGRTGAAHAQVERIVRRECDRQCAAHRCVTGGAVQVVVEAQRLAVIAVDAAQARGDVVGRRDVPCRGIAEVHERGSTRIVPGMCRAGDDDQQHCDDWRLSHRFHPFTLPSSSPRR